MSAPLHLPSGTPDDDVEPGAAPSRTGALPWVLVAAAAAPVLLAGEAGRQYFSGALDAQYFGYYDAGGDLVGDRTVPLLERWGSFAFAVPALPGLLGSTLGITVVTGLVLLDRPRWLVPGTAARWAACGVAVATTVAAALLLLLTLLVVSEDVDPDAVGGTSYVPRFTEVVGPVGVSLLAGVVSGMAAAVLARPPARPPSPAATPPPAPAEPLHDAPRDTRGDDGPVVPERGPAEREPDGPPAPVTLPRPGEADLDLYRRP